MLTVLLQLGKAFKGWTKRIAKEERGSLSPTQIAASIGGVVVVGFVISQLMAGGENSIMMGWVKTVWGWFENLIDIITGGI